MTILTFIEYHLNPKLLDDHQINNILSEKTHGSCFNQDDVDFEIMKVG